MSSRCPRCLGSEGACVCERIVRVDTRTRFVVLQHVLEQAKVSNTARVATLALSSCELWPYGAGDDARLHELDRAGTWLLFPGDDATAAPSPPPERVVVLDASWSQARRMVQRVDVLRRLPRISLSSVNVGRSLRRAPPGGMSTLQALARCVALLEGDDVARPLEVLHDELVTRVVRSRGYL